MAAPPSPTQVAGSNSAVYEAYYNFVDPKGVGTIGAMEAALFLKKSGLSDVVLSRVWDLSDPGGRGCLDKTGLYVALKLVALAQAGRDINIANIHLEMPPPKMGDIPMPKPKKPPPPSNMTPLITSLPPSAVDWAVKPAEREKYNKLFDSLQPLNGLIPGNKVKGVLMDSKLPIDTLGKIWELADQDKDGSLDRAEFVAAMHLVYKALEKHAIPNVLPSELLATQVARKPSMPPLPKVQQHHTSAPPPQRPVAPPLIAPSAAVPPSTLHHTPYVTPTPPLVSSAAPLLHSIPAPMAPPQASAAPSVLPMQQSQQQAKAPHWVVTPEDRAKSDPLFVRSDVDMDGFVSGMEIKDVFLQSGVPQPVLAHIWALCDIHQTGKLNNEQFALAMWFVQRCLMGHDPPSSLTSEMVPPSLRTNNSVDKTTSKENNNSSYSNPELDMVSKDIEELSREKLSLEMDIAQKEASVRVKSGEIKSLQSELDTLAATLKQLENQKGEAQKRLGDLKSQRDSVDVQLEEVECELDIYLEKVEKLRTQAADQAEVISTQEAELMSKKEQLESLRMEEQRLEQMKRENTNKLDGLSTKLQDTQLNISQAKALITQLEEQSRQMNDAITSCDSAIDSGDGYVVPEVSLNINPDFRDPQYTRIGMVNGEAQENGFDSVDDDPFNKLNANPANSGFTSDPFTNDPFKNNSDSFGSTDHFKTAFSNNDGFASDPFNKFNETNAPKADPFGAFGETNNTSVTPEPDKDAFGCDPFAVLHAPTRDGSTPSVGPIGPSAGRAVSPSPALPPKKAKPPRPAPPRPQPPTFQQKTADAFSSSGAGGGFADFADFDDKFASSSSVTGSSSSSASTLTAVPPVATTAPTPASVSATIAAFAVAANNANNNAATAKPIALDFPDDPFRDYRYEDPFNIAFDEETQFAAAQQENNGRKSAPPPSQPRVTDHAFDDDWAVFGATTTASTTNSKHKNGNHVNNNNNNASGRQSVPAVVTSSSTTRARNSFFTSSSSNNNNFRSSNVRNGGSSGGKSGNLDDDLAWAAKESLHMEEQRVARLRAQEDADLKLALELSRAENVK